MNCRICGRELTPENHEHNRRLCNNCRAGQKKLNYQNNKSHYSELGKDRYKEKRTEIREHQKKYSQTDGGKEANRKRNRKHKNKRERGLGWIPLNREFPNSEGHHLDEEHVLYVPKDLHQSIKHNVFSGKNMDLINEKVIDWYTNYYGLI